MISNEMKALILVAGCILASHKSNATEMVDGQYIWNFLSGQSWPYGYNQSTGKPDQLAYARNEYPTDFFNRIANALPEAKVNEAFLTGDQGSNITLQEGGEVSVTFLHEGAGYRNSFGFFTFDKNNPPTTREEIDETIIFPNLSYPHLTNGHRVNLGYFEAGTSIGFFIAANGFWYDTGVKPFAVPYYYSLKHLNPDPTDELRQHNVLLFDEDVAEVIIGFEDLPRSWGDNDFNDAVFSVKASPSTAIQTASLVKIPEANDSDADGIADSEDEFPNDYSRAFSSFFPSQTDWVTLAYEDNWPDMGDYDMNDLVVRERMQTTYDANGHISGVIIHGYIDARGASQHNGFALRLMSVAPSQLANASLNIAGKVYEKNAEAGQSDLVIALWQDSHTYTNTGESGSCSHFNTKADCATFDPVAFTLDISFSNAPPQLNHSDLDFFIFRTDFRGREIHFANYPPTNLFDSSQLGKNDDTSNPETNRYFKNASNLPWALKVTTNWCYPKEYIDVLWAFPEYETWVESSGQTAQNWFHSSARNTHYFCRDDNRFEPALPPQSASAANAIDCNIIGFSQLDGQIQVDAEIVNNGEIDLHSWSIAFDLSQAVTITDSWGVITSYSEAGVLVAENLGWNSLLIPGNTRSIGFQATSDLELSRPTCSAH
jgi:Cellulose binding domain.